MKTFRLFVLILLIVTGSCAESILRANDVRPDKNSRTYELIFADEFDTDGNLDTTKWSYAERWHPTWGEYLTATRDGIVWEPTKIEFFVNDQLQYTYHKPQNATAAEWPYDQAFYLILNQSGGAGWPGPIVKEDLPFEMEVDYIRVYQTIVK